MVLITNFILNIDIEMVFENGAKRHETKNWLHISDTFIYQLLQLKEVNFYTQGDRHSTRLVSNVNKTEQINTIQLYKTKLCLCLLLLKSR